MFFIYKIVSLKGVTGVTTLWKAYKIEGFSVTPIWVTRVLWGDTHGEMLWINT